MSERVALRRPPRARDYQRLAASSFLLLQSLLFLGAQPTSAEKPRQFSPVATLILDPLPGDSSADLPEEVPAEAMVIPDLRPYDEETWRRLKEAAEFDPKAQEPDAIVPPPESVASLVAPFDGWGYQQIHPADTTLAKSGQRILQAINSAIRLTDASGSLIQGRTLQNFFGAIPWPIPPIDPRVLYDRNAVNPRFFVIGMHWNIGPPASSYMYLAVSRSPNPPDLNAANWCVYGIPSTDDYGSGLPTFPDQPNIGVGADTFVLSANHATIPVSSGPVFTYAVIHAFDKIGLENNAAACPTGVAEVFRPASVQGDLNVFSLAPALHYNSPSSFAGTTNPAYLVNTRSGSSTTYWVWRLRNIRSGASPGNLQMTSVNGNFTYAIPLDAPQPDTSIKLDTGDTRVLQVGAVGNSLWVAHGTNCNTGGGPSEVCARVARINVSQNASGNPTATIAQQTTVSGGANIHYWMPGIAVNQSHRTALVFLWSSASMYQSSAWTAKDAGSGSYPASQSLGDGGCARQESNDPARPPRTGDYVGAHTDPTDFLTFWISGEHATVYPPPPAGSACTWLTRIRQVN